jgi:hypothetical protein
MFRYQITLFLLYEFFPRQFRIKVFNEAISIQEDVMLLEYLGLVILSVFFALARYRVVKIVCSYSKAVLRTMKNYKAHYSLS